MKASKITISNNLSELTNIVSMVDELVDKWELPAKLSFNINLVLEELITNTISYGYTDNKNHLIDIEISFENGTLIMQVVDDGLAFNPFDKSDPDDLDKDLEGKKIGGLGIYFVKNLVDGSKYERRDNKNIITLTKEIPDN